MITLCFYDITLFFLYFKRMKFNFLPLWEESYKEAHQSGSAPLETPSNTHFFIISLGVNQLNNHLYIEQHR